MNFTFNKSFQEMVEESAVPCLCGIGRHDPEPDHHSRSCPVTGFYTKWKLEGTVLWERIKHIPVKIKAYDRQHFDLPSA